MMLVLILTAFSFTTLVPNVENDTIVANSGFPCVFLGQHCSTQDDSEISKSSAPMLPILPQV